MTVLGTDVTQSYVYKHGYINEHGIIIKIPDEPKAFDEFRLLDCFIYRLKYLMSTNVSKLGTFRQLNYYTHLNNYWEKIRLLSVSGDMKMRKTVEILNQFLENDQLFM